MFERNKWLLGLIIGTMTFSGIAILDEIVIKMIFAASGAIAYSIVGSLLSTSFIMSRADAGEARMGFFVVVLVILLAIYVAIVNFVTWLLSFPLWVYILIFVVSVGLLILRTYLNKQADKKYESDHIESDIDRIEQEVLKIEKIDVNNEYSSPTAKTIYELLSENRNKKVIYVERIDNGSPGLQYVQVNQDALKYHVLKGYLKFDNSGVFREIYYAEQKIWRLYSYWS